MKIQGLYTALVTPFHNGAVDYDKLTRLVEMQIAAGVDGISPVGTTGESPTLSFEEHERVIATVVQLVNGRCKVLAGSGANSTAEALHLTRHAKADGADFSLQVAPYYNKPTQEGLYRHFATIADSCDIPIVIYSHVWGYHSHTAHLSPSRKTEVLSAWLLRKPLPPMSKPSPRR